MYLHLSDVFTKLNLMALFSMLQIMTLSVCSQVLFGQCISVQQYGKQTNDLEVSCYIPRCSRLYFDPILICSSADVLQKFFWSHIQSKWVLQGHKCLSLYYYCYYHSSQAWLYALVDSKVKVVLFPLEAVICVQQRPIPTDDIALPFNSPPQSMQESVIIH